MSSDDEFGLSDASMDASPVLKASNKKNVAAKATKKPAATKKAPAKKAKKEDKENEEDPMEIFHSIDNDKPGEPSIEDMYQKKTQLEHILLRPDTYIGSVEKTDPTTMWVYDDREKKIVQREVTYVPGLYKIFDEIIVNAADNKQRDKNMNCIKVVIDREANQISITNNGKGIPVVEHRVEKMWVPEMIFGTLLTSSNYDDAQKKVTGGRNGYGAKLCNIFSKSFTVETSSKQYNKAFKQTWTDNMQKTDGPKVTKAVADDYTKITFEPDLEKFRMDRLERDITSIMMRRAYDMAGILDGVKVYLNHERINLKGFEDYVKEYVKDKTTMDGSPLKVAFEKINNRWEVGIAVSEEGFQQVSFVNSIATTKGGRHVDYIADQAVPKLIEQVKKKLTAKSSINIKPFQMKNHMWVFVNCLIENPTFDSQTKETMTLQAKSFGSKAEMSEKFLKDCTTKTGLVDACLSWAKAKQIEQMDKKCSAKKTTKMKGIPKLEDANEAGTKNSLKCTLILTEGDSAKTLAVSGLGVVGRDYYGVFPLRGKLLNVREATHSQLMHNEEINALIKILGLQYKKSYTSEEDMKTLRYGKVMIMADQDQDGSHIKGLVINFIHHNWPTLTKHTFVEQFITPIVKVTKGKQEISFFSLPEYVQWKQETPGYRQWRVKYYKGLGTSTAKEAKEYFTNMQRHRVKFKHAGQDDDNQLEMAFSKKHIEERKEWLTKWMNQRRERRRAGLPAEEDFLYSANKTTISYNEFVNKELILFSNLDNERSIPCLVDGFKPGQRKVLFTCFKRNDKREVKVAQLAGSVAEQSAYHHGEQSLMMTIVNLAQNYVGSNNINSLLPIGQFGTRLQGGKDHASARYIFTMLNPVTRYLFPVQDDAVLRYLSEDNQRIEPEWYCPIIPTVLVNGASGIGTGWSTNIPNYNPRDLIDRIRTLMHDENAEIAPLVPWYKNFRGVIERLDATRFICYGEVAQVNDTTIEITELPVKTWTQSYKESVLEAYMNEQETKDKKKKDNKKEGEDKEEKKKQKALINDFKEYHTDTTVKFIVNMPKETLTSLERAGELHKTFKLQQVINTSSMVLFDAEGVLRRFDTPEQILREFVVARRNLYRKRKNYMVGLLKAEADRLSNQAKFILDKISGKIVMENKKKKYIVERLIELGYDPDPVKRWKDEQRAAELATGENLADDDDGEQAEAEGQDDDSQGSGSEDEDVVEAKRQSKKDAVPSWEKKLSDYDYLVMMTLIRLSEEEVKKLLEQRDKKHAELTELRGKSETDIWSEDLDAFLVALDKQQERERQDELGEKKKLKPNEKSAKGKKMAVKHDFMPSPAAIRVLPRTDPTLRAKYEKMEKAKNAPKKVRNKSGDSNDKKGIKDVEDDEDLPLMERVLKNSPHLKATATKPSKSAAPKSKSITAFMKEKKEEKKAAPKKKKGKDEWATDSDEESNADDIEQAFSEDDDDDIFIDDETPKKAPTKKRQAPAKSPSPAAASADDEPIAKKKKAKAIVESDDDEQPMDDEASKNSHSTKASSAAKPSKKKADPYGLSDDDEVEEVKAKKPSKKATSTKAPAKASKKTEKSKKPKKAAASSDDDVAAIESDPDAEIAAQPVERPTGRRAAAAAASKAKFIDSGSDESEAEETFNASGSEYSD